MPMIGFPDCSSLRGQPAVQVALEIERRHARIVRDCRTTAASEVGPACAAAARSAILGSSLGTDLRRQLRADCDPPNAGKSTRPACDSFQRRTHGCRRACWNGLTRLRAIRLNAPQSTEPATSRKRPCFALVPAFARIGEENAFAVLARATELAAQGRDIINLGIGQPDFPTPPHIVEAAVKALRDGHHGYTPATGILPLREAVAADLHRRFSASRSRPDSVMIVPGGKVTMFAAILMFGEPGAEILYPDPGLSDLPLDDRVHRRDARSRCRSARRTASPSRPRRRLSLITPRTRLLILNSPANPTGGVTPKRRDRRARRRASRGTRTSRSCPTRSTAP